jgi:hypothetical protein
MLKKEKKKDENSTNKLRYIVYLFALLAILSGIVVNVVSKYVRTNKEQAYVQAQEFYFESDLLTEEGKEYELASETTEIVINLRNNADELRYSQGDIKVVFEVTENGNSIKNETITLSGGKVDDEKITFEVEYGKTYEVTATGSCGFEKVLKGTFIITDVDETLYKRVEQTNEYVELTVWTKNLTGVVEISIPDGLIPDNTNDILTNVKTEDASFEDRKNFQNAYSSYTYRFFKTNNNSYDESDFDVTCTNGSAITE